MGKFEPYRKTEESNTKLLKIIYFVQYVENINVHSSQSLVNRILPQFLHLSAAFYTQSSFMNHGESYFEYYLTINA